MSCLMILQILAVFIGVIVFIAAVIRLFLPLLRYFNRRRIAALGKADRAVASELNFTGHPPDAEGRHWFTGIHGGRPVAFCHTLRWVLDGPGSLGPNTSDRGSNIEILRIVVQRDDLPPVDGAELCETSRTRFAAPGFSVPLVVYEEVGSPHTVEELSALFERLT